jgi:hypothetical protein
MPPKVAKKPKRESGIKKGIHDGMTGDPVEWTAQVITTMKGIPKRIKNRRSC